MTDKDVADENVTGRGIARARRELTGARLLVDHGLPEPAVSRAYYAAFYAAESALFLLGEARSKHSGVLSAFGQLVILRHGLDPDVGRLLRRLFTLRSEADYSFDAVSGETAQRAHADATRVVDAVEQWIATRTLPRPDTSPCDAPAGGRPGHGSPRPATATVSSPAADRSPRTPHHRGR